MVTEPARRAGVVGLGLIGGSLAAALRERGWYVTGIDQSTDTERRAVDEGVVDSVGYDPDAEVTFIATPVLAVPAAVEDALAKTNGVVTDVGSVKGVIAAAVNDPRFVPGHPMAGSEQVGLDGVQPDLFEGAVWVLTPTASTSDDSFALVRATVAALGADIITLDPAQHDRLVAVVSHVPHLTAASLMALASRRSDEHQALLRLAAGGFRDMTRIAAGHPGIWPDICDTNVDAITETLDSLIETLGEVRAMVATSDRTKLLEVLTEARSARVNLPPGVERPDAITELRIPVLDRPGELAAICSLADELGVNIYDLEIAHSAESNRGVVMVMVDTALAERLHGGLFTKGYRPSLRSLT